MSLTLTPEMLAAAYDYLRATPPFRAWRLPDSDDIEFHVGRHLHHRAWHIDDNGKHRLAVSDTLVGHTDTLMSVLAHEMIHLHQALSKRNTPNTLHNAAFMRTLTNVCRLHGFDPKAFL